MKQIIDSILQTDLYKISMQQCVYHQYPVARVAYVFKCRNEGIKLGFIADKVQEQVDLMSNLKLTLGERNYLGSLGFFKDDFLDFLETYSFNPAEVHIKNEDGDLKITIGGFWVDTILWEVPLLAIVNELYFANIQYSYYDEIAKKEGNKRLTAKIEMLKEYPTLTFSEFGTRRRFSAKWQRHVTTRLSEECPQMTGTSNVKLAMELGIKPVGTMAHEFFSAHLALTQNIAEAQKRALYVWLQEYGGKLSIALADTFTSDAFFKDFDPVLTKAYDGVRQDSGDAIEFGEKAIKHYKDMGIDPRTKTIIFSDGLNFPKMLDIWKHFTGRINPPFGVGTDLTNSLGLDPLNIVIKLVECNGIPVVKLSDSPSKAIGDAGMIRKVKNAYGVEG